MPIDLMLHIPDAEVEQDIADTRAEIRSLRWQSERIQKDIAERQAFVDRLEVLLALRKQIGEPTHA